MAETLTIRTSSSTDVIKVVERGPQGPTGPQGPAGEGGASTWNDITGKPATFPPSAHDHQPGEVYADAAFVSQTGGSGRGGIYLRNGSDNGKPLYESPATGDYIWWDSNIDTWYLTSRTDVNLFEITNNTDNFPWETDALWQPIAPQTGNVEVDQASLFDVSDYSSTSVVGLKTPKSGNASSDELVLGSDTRLTNSRTPTAHASTHHTGGSDPLTPANIGAAPAVNVIELTPNGTTTITTSQLPARGIAYIEGGASFTVNLPTPDKRQSGLTFSIKTEHELSVTGAVFITVVHNAVNLLTAYELDEDESSLDFLWDGYRWTYSSANWLYSYPNRELVIPPLSGTIARTEDFASPPAIGNTTPAAGSFTTLNATGTTELVNGGTTAGPFRVYNTFTSATNFERLNLRWASNVAIIGTEKGSAGGTARALEFQVDSTTRFALASTGRITINPNDGSSGDGVTITSSRVGGNPRALVITDGGITCTGGQSRFLFGSDVANVSNVLNNFNNALGLLLRRTSTGTGNFIDLQDSSNVSKLLIDKDANFVLPTSGGVKIGTATNQLLGFYGVTPVDQPATVADPAGGGTVDAEARTAINAVIDRLQELGLIA